MCISLQNVLVVSTVEMRFIAADVTKFKAQKRYEYKGILKKRSVFFFIQKVKLKKVKFTNKNRKKEKEKKQKNKKSGMHAFYIQAL